MRPNVRVIEKPGYEPSLEVFLKKWPEVAKAQCVFELFPKSFDDGNGAGLTDSAEPLPYSEAGEKPPKSGVDVLASLVGYKVSWDSETSHGFEKKERICWAVGSLVKTLNESGIREKTSKMTAILKEKGRKVRHIGQVGHPDVTWVTCLDGTRFGSFGCGSFGICRRWFFTYSSNRFRRDFPPGSCECLSDELVPTESEPGHGLDELTDHVGITADRRIWLDGGLFVGRIQGRCFPTVDSMTRKTKKPRRLLGR